MADETVRGSIIHNVINFCFIKGTSNRLVSGEGGGGAEDHLTPKVHALFLRCIFTKSACTFTTECVHYYKKCIYFYTKMCVLIKKNTVIWPAPILKMLSMWLVHFLGITIIYHRLIVIRIL